MARAFFAGHNYLINLDEDQDGTEHYHQMFAFLRQSRIAHVLTHAPVICEPYLMEFWENARYIKRGNGEVIVSRVANNEIEFTAEDLRLFLNLGSVDQEGGGNGLTVFDRSIIIGGLQRMGFAGDMTKSTIFKKGFYGRWRYLAHVLLVGLSNKKTGWDTLNQEAQAQLVGIVYNKPYSFSKFFFNEFRKQISARGTMRFLMYPRFVMMIISARLPNLPVVEPVRRVTTLVKRSYNEFMTRNANDPNAQDVEIFGALVNINYATPSDEAIASFEVLPAAEPQQPQPQQPQQQQQQPPQQPPLQQQPQPQPEVAAQQINVMLDEEAANPQLAQAVIHDVLQELAPVDDPIADTEAYHDSGMPDFDDAPVGIGSRVDGDEDDHGKGISDMGDDDSSSSSSDDDSDDDDSSSEEEMRPQLIRMGSRMVSKGGSSSGSKRKETDDPDYRPVGEVLIETPQTKKARPTEGVSSTAVNIQETTEPSSSKITKLEDKLMMMEALVKSMSDKMEQQQATHAQEVEALNKKNERLDNELIKMRQVVTRLAQSFDESRTRVDALETDQSTQLAHLQVRVSDLDRFSKTTVTEAKSMAHHVHSVLENQHQGIIRVKEFAEKLDQAVAALGMRIDLQATCRDDPLRKAGRRDGDDDPDLARQGRMPSFPSNLAHHASTFKGESSRDVGQSSGGARDDVQDTSEFDTGFDHTSSSDLSDHDNLIREIQIKFGHDRLLAENVYADLMERKFQKKTAFELCNENKEQSLADSLSSSDSDYVPEKDK